MQNMYGGNHILHTHKTKLQINNNKTEILVLLHSVLMTPSIVINLFSLFSLNSSR